LNDVKPNSDKDFVGFVAPTQPTHLTASGLPIAMQVMGHRWCDRALLTLASQIAKSTEFEVTEKPERTESHPSR
jgi:Asp-tRNA(Asn)/Glu-tRNA(Gln) amidotransferase A subunit family amidase